MIKPYSVLRIAFILLQNLTHIPAYLFTTCVVLYPLYLINVQLYRKIENFMYNFLLYTVSSWSWYGKIRVHEYGDNFSEIKCKTKKLFSQDGDKGNGVANGVKAKSPRLLVIANHQSTSDVPLMFQMFTCYWQKILLWVMDRQFKYTNFGLVSWTHGDYFIQPGKFQPKELTNHCLNHTDKNCYILFPEGGFRYKKMTSSKRYSEKMNLPDLKHVTWPRYGAFNELIDKRLGVTHIVDLTIIYPHLEETLSIIDILKGDRPADVQMIYRIFPLDEIEPTSEWLNQLWKDKEQTMADFYKNQQKFLSSQTKFNEVKLSLGKAITINIIYLLLSWFYLYIFLFKFF